MYSRKLGDRLLRFGHEGILYRNSFIMYDRATRSLWVHTSGECIKGELKGEQLDFIPSVVTSWGAWKKSHPESWVLEGERATGFMGTFSLKKSRLKEYGFSVGQGNQVRLYRAPDLKRLHVIQDTLGGDEIVVFSGADGLHATAWIKGEHEFSWNGKAVVDATGRRWDTMLGMPMEGSSSNPSIERLTPVAVTPWLVKRWRGFYSESQIYVAPQPKRLRWG